MAKFKATLVCHIGKSKMASVPKRQEIDHRTTKLVVGIIAISLAALTGAFASSAITSISALFY
jgi:hypothetical protein